ncbi:MAG: hypothetical protein ACOYXY_14325 [Thermodesulfobacteriota bacterium]
MTHFKRCLALMLPIIFFYGWVSYYWAWYDNYYSTCPENYAYPASFSRPDEPRWGFWFW